MAKARALDRRRKSIRSTRKITRTMELVATAQFRRAMDRAVAASSYTKRIVSLVNDLAHAGVTVTHPLLEERPEIKNVALLVLTANRGMCGGYNANMIRLSMARWKELQAEFGDGATLELSGKRGISAFHFRGIQPDRSYTQFEHKPTYDEVDELASRYIEEYYHNRIDRLEIIYTKFISMSKQEAVRETLLPMTELVSEDDVLNVMVQETAIPDDIKKSEAELRKEAMIRAAQAKLAKSRSATTRRGGEIPFEFYPSAQSVMEEIVPSAFRIKLFKCFLDAGVNEQISRMVAMKAATENADKIISALSTAYNRARQGQITNEIIEVTSGFEALGG
ncbi:MAG: ATP synthase F1 subunit gamma [Planctomycetaceae bacterium]|nr:ATP synthase F1 subunit gamma [Planctomycetaceae bacterium]